MFRAGQYHLFCALIDSNFKNSAKPFSCILSSPCHSMLMFPPFSPLIFWLLCSLFSSCSPFPAHCPPTSAICLLTLDQHFTPVFQHKGLQPNVSVLKNLKPQERGGKSNPNNGLCEFQLFEILVQWRKIKLHLQRHLGLLLRFQIFN